jgi:hypothetical protein
MSGRNTAILLLVVLALICWALGYFQHRPLLDALGSVFAIVALVMRWTKKSAPR